MPRSFEDFVSRLLIILVAFPIHEYAHAWTADYFGDDTPYVQGRVTLNPLKHIDWFGALLLMTTGFGWAKPVMVNPFRLTMRSRHGPLLVALAGPISNFLLALVVGIFVRSVGPLVAGSAGIVAWTLSLLNFFVFFNFVLMLFNMIPVVPLDGEKILYELLSPAGQDVMLRIRSFTMGPLLVLFFFLPMLNINILGFMVWNPAVLLTKLILP